MVLENLLSLGWLGFAVAAWLGLCVGSFLNVVIYRLPVMLERDFTANARAQLELPEETPDTPFNLMVPRSRCPQCDSTIRAWHNIPVIGWIILKGRCANCANPIAPRYPIVEALTGILTLFVLAVFGFTPLGYLAVLYTWVLLALTFIDFDTQLLPDQLTLPLLWLGLLVNLNGTIVPLETAVIGAVIGYLFLWLTYWGFKLLTGKEGMGYGDFKLLAAVGAWLGWPVLPAVILIASIAGLTYALVNVLLGRSNTAQPIAFGPFLAVGGWVCLLYRDTVVRWLLG